MKRKATRPSEPPDVRPHELSSSGSTEARAILRARGWCGWESRYGWRAPADILTPVLFTQREDLEAWIAEHPLRRRCNAQHHVDAIRAAYNADVWLATRTAGKRSAPA